MLRPESAKMQGPSWNDLRTLLALGRGRSLAGAARLLGVDDTTVARRLQALEASLGVRLCERAGDGAVLLTAAGEQALLRAERMEREVGALGASLKGMGDEVAGTVRLSAVPIVANYLLVPAVAPLLARHPGLRLEIVGEPREVNLARREADLALRLARPKTGGTKLLARRVGQLAYAIYVPALGARRGARTLPWVGYDEATAHLPQARWIEARAAAEPVASLRLADAEAVLEAVAAGLGRSLLPCAIADGDGRLSRVGAPVLARELWLLTPAELRTLGRIEAVTAWIEETVPR
jgi:DNA-binding transcriptional LysR family regulator